MATALTIKVKENEKLQGASGKWIDDLSTQMPRITNNIITPDVQGDGQISAIVSGIPTAFARPVLFEKALGYSSNMGQGTSDGLHKYYSSLVDEWRGLIACLALDTDANSLNVETVTLAYSDGKGYKDTQNIYEPKGAFGNMLLDERDLWCDQTATDFKLVSPQISIIKYKGRVIGGTSPKVLVFTSAMYEIEDSLPYVNPKTKKFTDPLKLGTLTPSQYLNLYAYLNKLMDRFSGLSGYFKQQVPDYTAIQKELQAWLDEIDKVIVEKNYDKSKASPLPVSYFKQEPYRSFFNYSNELYSVNGIIYSEKKDHAVSFKPSSLLLPHDTELVHVRFVRPDYAKDLSKLPLTLLRASRIDGNGYDDFALPLSETGIKVFEKNIDALLRTKDTPSDIGSSLRASYDPKNNNTLKVELNITTKEGVLQSITVNYRVNNNILQNTDILIWPNFASAQWNKYFLYSEMPHDDHTNDCPFETVPFCGNCDSPQFDIITKEKGNNSSESEIAVLAKDGHAQSIEGLDVQLDVVSDYRTNDQRYKYEIYECSKPFRGIQISRAGKVCGYFLIRYTTDKDMTELPYNYGTTQMELEDVNLGVDFGSTNTSVAYSTTLGTPTGFTFHDQRISLLGGTHIKKDHDKLPTLESSVFFFQRDEIGSNMVKSMLTLHDKLRMPDGKEGEPVAGGFPCFSRDLPISLVKGDHISLLFKNSGAKAEIVNDMKWKGDDADKNHRTAFLSTLMLHVYAELFTKKLVPVTLKWSYPSAMGFNLLQQYSELWNKLSKISPVIRGGKQEILTVYPRPDITVNTDDGGGVQWTEGQSQTDDGFAWGTSARSPWGNDQQNPWGSSSGGDDGSSTPGCGSGDNGVSGTNGQMQGWGSEDNSAFGWGCEPSELGWGQPKATAPKIKDLVPDNGPVEFKIKPLPNKTSLTEACAVANHKASKSNAILTLCFDIGGSTTDISAICYMKDKDGLQHLTLIKQSSIRFAAQRISKATSVLYVPFKKVLLDICNEFNLPLTGLNIGEDKYNAETAPYFYEQIVDMLSPEQQVAFYHKIAADCPGLFSVNLYVTGLIMYYAGQITEKLIKEVRRSPDGLGDKWSPYVFVTFAGKGSRIFDWFSCINKEGAKQYCTKQFVHGMGGIHEALTLLVDPQHLKFDLSDKVKEDIKYEVAYGLANQNISLYVPSNEGGIEILGEEGFSIIAASTGKSTPLKFDNSVTPEMMQQLGVYFMPPSPNSPCKRFMDFAGVFYVFAQKMFNLKMTQSEFMEGFRNMNINSYIQDQPEYREAQLRSKDANGKFDYVNPIIILEGMKFYEDYLLKGIVK